MPVQGTTWRELEVRCRPVDNAASRLQAVPLADRRMLASVTSDSIRSKEFSVVLRGLSPTEVRQYLAQVAQWVDVLKREIIQLAGEPTPSQQAEQGAADIYGDLGTRMAEVLRAVDTQAQQLRREVEEQASRHLEEAHRQAEQLQAEAQAEAERTRQEATQAVRELVGRRDSLVTELEGLLGLVGTITDLLQQDLEKFGRPSPRGELAAPDSRPAVIGAVSEYASTHYGRS